MTDKLRERMAEEIMNGLGKMLGMPSVPKWNSLADYLKEPYLVFADQIIPIVREQVESERRDGPGLRVLMARVLHKVIRQFEVEGCPGAFDLKVHIDQLLSCIPTEQVVREDVLKEYRDYVVSWMDVIYSFVNFTTRTNVMNSVALCGKHSSMERNDRSNNYTGTKYLV